MDGGTAKARRSHWPDMSDYRVDFYPTAKRIRAAFGGQTIADSLQAHLLLETRHVPVYYLPRDDVRMDLLHPTEHTTFCPFKGEARYWSVGVGDRTAENAVWSYEDTFPEVAAIGGHLGFYFDRMDAWYEEDQEVFVHPSDPHVRIDIRDSGRAVRISLGGVTIAESVRARFLFETGLPARYYLPREDVRMDLLFASEKRTRCPYKGEARYFSLRVGDGVVSDVAWTYAHAHLESAAISGYVCFDPKQVDALAGAERSIEKSAKSAPTPTERES